MSGLYEEPRRATYLGDVGLDEPVLLAGVDISNGRALIVHGSGTMEVVSLDWVKVDWRYIAETDAWKDLVDLRQGPPIDDTGGDDVDTDDDEALP